MSNEEKIERAAQAMYEASTDGRWENATALDKHNYRMLSRVALPILGQWEMPSTDEFRKYAHQSQVMTYDEIFQFVKDRNAALQPNPVDPRREQIMAAIKSKSWIDNREARTLTNAIIKALDGEK